MATLDSGTTDTTTFGAGNKQHVLYVKTEATAEKPSILALDAVSGSTRVTYYIWVDSTGDLRIHSAIPTDEDSDGSVVGSQS